MRLYSENKSYKLYEGSMLDMFEDIEPCSIDAIVTDPPYELNFMNKGLDNADISFQKETWEKCFEALKPGGHMLVFGGSRTFHRIACAIEDAGFEIRDVIMWLYGSGFPKSLSIGKQIESTDLDKKWSGLGTSLKPSFEPIILARKPIEGSIIDTVMKYGVGGINIDECRIEGDDTEALQKNWINRKTDAGFGGGMFGGPVVTPDKVADYTPNGRFPANTILTYDETDYDEVCGGMPESGSGNGSGAYSYFGREYNNRGTSMFNGDKPHSPSNYNDNGSAARYFYCAKASKRDRDEGLNDLKEALPSKNTHPTVKPTDLMQYLIRLITPKGGTVLDPFNGSGSTGKATMYENKDRNADYKYIGIELTEEYLPIAKGRIEFVCNGGIEKEVIKKKSLISEDAKIKATKKSKLL